MAVNFDAKNFFYRCFDRLNPRVAKFDYFARIGKYDMVVLFVKIRFFVMCLLIAELMFPNQFCVQQKFNRIVQSRAAYPVLFVFHHNVQTIDVKMLVREINFLQNRITFRRFPVPMFFQKIGKNLSYNLIILLFYSIHTHFCKVLVKIVYNLKI